MSTISKEEMIKKFPKLANFYSMYSFFSDEEYKLLVRGRPEIISIDRSSDHRIDLNLLKIICADSNKLDHLKQCILSGIGFSYLGVSSNGNFTISRKAPIASILIIKSIKYAASKGLITLDALTSAKVEEIYNEAKYEKFKERSIDKVYQFVFNNKQYSIGYKPLFKYLEADVEELEDLILNNAQYEGLDTRLFIYAIVNFAKDVLQKKSLLNRSIISNLKTISTSSLLDIQSYIYGQERDDVLEDIIDKVKLDPYLEERITKNMPSNYSPIKKAIYIYIMMCKTFNYNDEFYVSGQKGKVAREHENIDFIGKINKDNLDLICYEFNAIYAYLIRKYAGIEKMMLDGKVVDRYGGGHQFLTFVSDNYVISADSTTSIVTSDMSNAKLDLPLEGLSIKNTSEKLKDDFDDLVANVYESCSISDEDDDFASTLLEYQLRTDKIKSIAIEERVEILLSKTSNSSLASLPLCSYIHELSKLLFSDDELSNKISIIFARDNISKSRPCLTPIISYNKLNMLLTNTNAYYIYNYDKKAYVQKPYLELANLFDKDEFEYVSSYNGTVPGIRNKKGK